MTETVKTERGKRMGLKNAVKLHGVSKTTLQRFVYSDQPFRWGKYYYRQKTCPAIEPSTKTCALPSRFGQYVLWFDPSLCLIKPQREFSIKSPTGTSKVRVVDFNKDAQCITSLTSLKEHSKNIITLQREFLMSTKPDYLLYRVKWFVLVEKDKQLA